MNLSLWHPLVEDATGIFLYFLFYFIYLFLAVFRKTDPDGRGSFWKGKKKKAFFIIVNMLSCGIPLQFNSLH